MLVCISVAVTVAPGNRRAAGVGDVAEQRAGDGLRAGRGRDCEHADEHGRHSAHDERSRQFRGSRLPFGTRNSH